MNQVADFCNMYVLDPTTEQNPTPSSLLLSSLELSDTKVYEP